MRGVRQAFPEVFPDTDAMRLNRKFGVTRGHSPALYSAFSATEAGDRGSMIMVSESWKRRLCIEWCPSSTSIVYPVWSGGATSFSSQLTKVKLNLGTVKAVDLSSPLWN